MFSSLFGRSKIFNQQLHDYCLKSTNESIQKMIERMKEERKKNQFKLILANPSSNSPSGNPIIPIIIIFFSISSIFYNLYYRKR